METNFLLTGAGYTMRNVARCWTAETAVALDTELDPQLPFTDYYEYIAPCLRMMVEMRRNAISLFLSVPGFRYFGPDYGLPITPR